MQKDAGVSLLFPPEEEPQIQTQVRLIVLHADKPDGQSRWNLDNLGQACSHLFSYQDKSGLCKLLKRLGISYQKGRAYIHSRDEAYQDKLAYIRNVITQAQTDRVVVLAQDEFTFYSEAKAAYDYAPQGHQPLACWSYDKQYHRISAAMNVCTGQVSALMDKKIGIQQFVTFMEGLQQDYPRAEVIFLIVDNCPLHFHPSVQAALVEQEHPFELHLSPSWAEVKPQAKYIGKDLPIQMIPLPTYASWLNPIEKLWKLLRKELLHLHPFSLDFKELIGKVRSWLTQFDQPCHRLLQFCGLLKSDGIYADALRKAQAANLKKHELIFQS